MILYSQGVLTDIAAISYERKGEKYFNNIICFDIETTSGFLIDGVVQSFDYSKPCEFYDDKEKVSLCYIWVLSIDGNIYYNRELSEFKKCVDELHDIFDGHFTIWVHNLSFEFQFLLNLFDFEKIFAKNPHKVIYAEYGFCRFRCSYFLTRLSLDSWGKSIGVHKRTGDLDYNIIRTPLTELTETELKYVEMDVVVMHAGITKYLNKYKKMYSIPLTQTGEIRKKVKTLYSKDMNYHNKVTKLFPKNAKEYARLVEVFAGGYTHANYTYSNCIMKNVHSKDETSAYPTMLVAYKFPMSRWWEVDNINPYLHNDNYSLIVDVTFTNLESVCFNNYLSVSKAYDFKGVVKDNGRIVYADSLSITMTGIDLEIVERAYKWDSMEVNIAFASSNGYLDTRFVKLILEKYKEKTAWKNVAGYEDIYMTSKEFINSLYGMMVTGAIQENVFFSDGEWSVQNFTEEQMTEELQKKIKKPYSIFLAYQWGVFVTAYARRALWQAVFALDEDIIYMDTDSVKYIGEHEEFFNAYNKEITAELKKACEYHGIDFELTKPKDSDGIERPLGIFDTEPDYDEFITLGAKRYAYKIGDKIGITVAGANKKKGVSALNGDLKNFRDGLVFNYEQSGRSIATYLSDIPCIEYPDGYISNYKYGINLMPTTYTMGISEDYDIMLGIVANLKTNFKSYDIEDIHRIARG